MIEDFEEALLGLISPAILWVIFLVTVFAFVVVSIALMYHWKNYNANSALGRRVVKIYFLVSGGFLFAMLMAVIAYST